MPDPDVLGETPPQKYKARERGVAYEYALSMSDAQEGRFTKSRLRGERPRRGRAEPALPHRALTAQATRLAGRSASPQLLGSNDSQKHAASHDGPLDLLSRFWTGWRRRWPSLAEPLSDGTAKDSGSLAVEEPIEGVVDRSPEEVRDLIRQMLRPRRSGARRASMGAAQTRIEVAPSRSTWCVSKRAMPLEFLRERRYPCCDFSRRIRRPIATTNAGQFTWGRGSGVKHAGRSST